MVVLSANAADDAIPVDQWNPKGYGESWSLMRFNDELLRVLGCDAWSVPALDEGGSSIPGSTSSPPPRRTPFVARSRVAAPSGRTRAPA